MKKILQSCLKLFVYTICLYGGFCRTARADVCTANQIDVLGDGTNCVDTKFSITTINLVLPDDSEFKFYMSASGTFYVDCGADGVLTSDMDDVSNGHIITRVDTTGGNYVCEYQNGGAKTIRFGGVATGYKTAAWAAETSTIRFVSKTIASVSGSLGAIFPTLSTSNFAKQPEFQVTFYEQKNITSIPADLFLGVTGNGYGLFFGTFADCSNLASIPENLFSGISGAADEMFRSTFMDTAITQIPANLFAGVNGGAVDMFAFTFRGCKNLRAIPENLFSGVTGGASGMFLGTFQVCTSLSGYIPASTFSGLIANNSPIVENMWGAAFDKTQFATTCPSGTTQFTTGYEDYWGGRVSCVDENLVCGAGEYLPAHWYQCESCPVNNYCTGGTYPYSETTTSGITACSNGRYTPAGMWESAQCGRILHIGDQVVYLRSVKKTVPSLNVDIDNDGIPDYFGNMTVLDVPMTRGTGRKLKLQYGGQTYSVYDDSVDLPNE